MKRRTPLLVCVMAAVLLLPALLAACMSTAEGVATTDDPTPVRSIIPTVAGMTTTVPDVPSSGVPMGTTAPGGRSPAWFEESDPALRWTGAWSTASDGRAHGGGYAYVAGKGSVSIRYEGESLTLFCPAGPDYGFVKILWQGPDGQKEYSVDLYSASLVFPGPSWTSPHRPSGVYSIRVDSTGTKNERSTGSLAGIDAVSVEGGMLIR